MNQKVRTMTRENGELMIRSSLHPSESLRVHFLQLALQVRQWSSTRAEPIRLGIIGVRPQIGTSTVAYNLADALASSQSGSVLMVEANFGHSYILPFANKFPGLSELIKTETGLDSCLMSSHRENLQAIGPGRISERAALELPLENLTPVIREHMYSYRYVLLDLPPIGDLNASRPLASQLDGLLVVTEENEANSSVLVGFQRYIANSEVQILGLVVNRARKRTPRH